MSSFCFVVSAILMVELTSYLLKMGWFYRFKAGFGARTICRTTESNSVNGTGTCSRWRGFCRFGFGAVCFLVVFTIVLLWIGIEFIPLTPIAENVLIGERKHVLNLDGIVISDLSGKYENFRWSILYEAIKLREPSPVVLGEHRCWIETGISIVSDWVKWGEIFNIKDVPDSSNIICGSFTHGDLEIENNRIGNYPLRRSIQSSCIERLWQFGDGHVSTGFLFVQSVIGFSRAKIINSSNSNRILCFDVNGQRVCWRKRLVEAGEIQWVHITPKLTLPPCHSDYFVTASSKVTVAYFFIKDDAKINGIHDGIRTDDDSQVNWKFRIPGGQQFG